MSVLLQISDPHFGTEQAPVVEALRHLVRDLSPDVLVVSGDVTQRARRSQFGAARRFIDALRIPLVLTLPGNHDIPLFNVAARVLWPYRGYRRDFGQDLEPELDLPDLLVLGVNTTRPWRHVDGEISPRQIERVSSRLRAASARQVRIVVTHQPMRVLRAGDAHDLVHGHATAARAWSGAGADLVMGGHIHLPYVAPMTSPENPVSRRTWCVQAGTAVSARVRHEAPNSVNLVRCGSSGGTLECVVERWDYGGSPSRFQKVADDSLDLDREPKPASGRGDA